MTLKEFNELIKFHGIPEDATLMSDSGWECSATDMDGVYYNAKDNIIVFTQDISEYDDYYKSEGWVALIGLVDGEGKPLTLKEAAERVIGVTRGKVSFDITE